MARFSVGAFICYERDERLRFSRILTVDASQQPAEYTAVVLSPEDEGDPEDPDVVEEDEIAFYHEPAGDGLPNGDWIVAV
jgi:hypothetical protein